MRSNHRKRRDGGPGRPGRNRRGRRSRRGRARHSGQRAIQLWRRRERRSRWPWRRRWWGRRRTGRTLHRNHRVRGEHGNRDRQYLCPRKRWGRRHRRTAGRRPVRSRPLRTGGGETSGAHGSTAVKAATAFLLSDKEETCVRSDSGIRRWLRQTGGENESRLTERRDISSACQALPVRQTGRPFRNPPFPLCA